MATPTELQAALTLLLQDRHADEIADALLAAMGYGRLWQVRWCIERLLKNLEIIGFSAIEIEEDIEEDFENAGERGLMFANHDEIYEAISVVASRDWSEERGEARRMIFQELRERGLYYDDLKRFIGPRLPATLTD